MSRSRASRPMLRNIAPVVVVLLLIGFIPHVATGHAHVTRHHIPYFLAADHPTLHSLVRVTWRTCRRKPDFTIRAYDDSGAFRGIVEFPWDPGPGGCGRNVVEFNSEDLERGIGSGEGDWQLFVDSTHTLVNVTSFVSTEDGFMVPMHDTLPFIEDKNGYHVIRFDFGDTHEARLRIINPNNETVYVDISGRNDYQGSGSGNVWIPLAPHETITATEEDLTTYNPAWHRFYPGAGPDLVDRGLIPDGGALRVPIDGLPGSDRWRLNVQAWRLDGEGYKDESVPLIVMSLIEDAQTGLLANLSSLPDTTTDIVRSGRPETGEDASDTFDIEFAFAAAVPDAVRRSFYRAAARWESVIVGNLPAENVLIYNGECGGSQGYRGEVDDLLVFVSMAYLGGRSGPQGRAGVCVSGIRGDSVTPMPVAGWAWVNRDATDNWDTVSSPFLDAIVTHELGHALGFTTSILAASGYLRYYPTRHFTGPLAQQAFIDQGGGSYAGDTVPMEADGSHWHDDVLSGEIMAPSIGSSSVISRITVQALADLGYEVDLNAAEFYYKNVF